jgi:hypothetical protein
MNYSTTKPRHRTLNVFGANALRKMYTLFSIASILWLTPTAANSKDYPPNACALIAVKGHYLLPNSSVILNLHATTNFGRKIGHAVLLVPLRSGFYIYDERGSFWFQQPFDKYHKPLLVVQVLHKELRPGEYFMNLAMQVAL